ncbi:hypothetical protein [uncultured Clostridium sp.]|uniref:hypothetical protein n=1 Tax=uncultured Clostridium sp. TaxID=59620 RepID=UPI00260781C0|nr:hypothetical protein [uncultured Clostridium sp.]
MKLKKCKYLILAVSIFFVLGLIANISNNNNKPKDEGKLVIVEDNKDLFEENYKSNLIIESDDNNIVSNENEDDKSIKVLPENIGDEIITLPNPNINEEVILKRL